MIGLGSVEWFYKQLIRHYPNLTYQKTQIALINLDEKSYKALIALYYRAYNSSIYVRPSLMAKGELERRLVELKLLT